MQTGTSEFPDSLTDKAVADEGLVKFEDEDLSQKLKSVFSKAGVEKLFNKFLSQAGEEAVQDAMAAASDAVLEEGEEPATNVDLFSVLELATAHIIAVAGTGQTVYKTSTN